MTKKSKEKNADTLSIKKTKDTTSLKHSAIGAKLSTMGIGLEYVVAINKIIYMRLSASYYRLNDVETLYENSVPVDVASENIIGGAYIMFDFQLLKRWHATAGIIYKVDRLEGAGQAASGITIGGVEIPGEVVGNISYAVINNGIAPYLGIGYGRSITFEKRLSFCADVGVYYHNNKKVEVEATGMLRPTALQKEQLEENAGTQKFFPYVSVQLSLRIF